MGNMSKKLFFAVLFCLGLTQLSFANNLKTVNSQKLQAVYSHKFLKFVSWSPAVKSSEFVFCILLTDKETNKAWSGLNHKKSALGSIVVRHYSRVPSGVQLAACNGVYLDSGFPLQGLENVLAKSAMLTIVQEDISRKNIGVFIFSQQDKNLEFKVNLNVAQRKGIQVNTSLLLLAKEVIR